MKGVEGRDGRHDARAYLGRHELHEHRHVLGYLPPRARAVSQQSQRHHRCNQNTKHQTNNHHPCFQNTTKHAPCFPCSTPRSSWHATCLPLSLSPSPTRGHGDRASGLTVDCFCTDCFCTREILAAHTGLQTVRGYARGHDHNGQEGIIIITAPGTADDGHDDRLQTIAMPLRSCTHH